jgi:ribosomal protein S27AE
MTDVEEPSKLPQSAADPRPGGRPAYISAKCPDCGTALVLLDSLENPTLSADELWHDEWTCPTCQDGIFMDWPVGAYERE